jgi:hypothetical protein
VKKKNEENGLRKRNYGRKDERKDGRKDERKDGRKDGRKNGRKDGRMDGRKDRRKDGNDRVERMLRMDSTVKGQSAREEMIITRSVLVAVL